MNFQIRHGAEIAKAQQQEHDPDQLFTFDSWHRSQIHNFLAEVSTYT